MSSPHLPRDGLLGFSFPSLSLALLLGDGMSSCSPSQHSDLETVDVTSERASPPVTTIIANDYCTVYPAPPMLPKSSRTRVARELQNQHLYLEKFSALPSLHLQPSPRCRSPRDDSGSPWAQSSVENSDWSVKTGTPLQGLLVTWREGGGRLVPGWSRKTRCPGRLHPESAGNENGWK